MAKTAITSLVPAEAMLEGGNALPNADIGHDVTVSLIEKAISSGYTSEAIQQLMSLAERNEARLARAAFNEAMAKAMAEIPTIIKNREVNFNGSKGRTYYKYEDLAHIERQVRPILAGYGLSYCFRPEQTANNVTVTCRIMHRDGHFEETSISAPVDQSGNKNVIQAIGSAITYLQRYTLKAALGLASSTDDDGRGVSLNEDSRTNISRAQQDELTALIQKTNTDISNFYAHFGIESLSELSLSQFTEAKGALLRKSRIQ